MKQTVEHYIANLLYLHDCVIIPGFGGFVGNKKSAYINPISGIIYSPSKQLLFNKNLIENDGLLATHIAKMENINLTDVVSIIDDFTKKINDELQQKNSFKLNKIGVLTKWNEGNISFQQDKNQNYNLNAFGLKQNYNYNKIERSFKFNKELNVQAITKKDSKKTIYRAAAVLIPLIGISLFSITQQEKINTVYSQMANLNPLNSINSEDLFSSSKQVDNNEIPINLPVEIKKTDHDIVTSVSSEVKVISKEITSPVLLNAKRYYIIAGAFSQEKNAKRLLNKLKKRNYNSRILQGSKLMRVSYNSFKYKKDAILVLGEIRKENKSAWLLRQ